MNPEAELSTLKLLVTGFGPFPGVPINPAEDLIRHLTLHINPDRMGVHLKTHIFPTEWQKVREDLSDLFRTSKPDICLHFGYHKNAKGFRFETSAQNSTANRVDACGCFPDSKQILKHCHRTLKTNLPLHSLAWQLTQRNIPTELSNNAGRYLCNYLYFLSLFQITQTSRETSACFIHIPAFAGGNMANFKKTSEPNNISKDILIDGTIQIIKSAVHHYHASIAR